MLDSVRSTKPLRLTDSVTIALLLLTAGGAAPNALEPPRPGQIAQYEKDGTLAERVAAAEALGNHKVAPRLAWDAGTRLHRLATGKEPPEAFTPPPCWQGGLPASGTPKILTLLIAFSDTPPVTGDTQPLIASKLFGDGTDGLPYDSLRNFYRRSSYNQLDIGGDALGWYTTAYPRSNVPETTTGRENLIKETLNYYDALGHDFSQYDNDGDGTVDYFAVIWTGTHGAWASFWWGYQTDFYDSSYTLDGKMLGAYSWQWESYDYPSGLFEPSTIIHETGHALGLPDYYDYDGSVGPDGGVGGLDQMDGYGDHNCFSKFLLDWISPAVCSLGGAHVATLHPSESSQDAILAMPNASGSAFEEYFMIQVRNQTQNDVWYPASGILIWHVDARLDAGNCDYRYNNSYTAHKLLRLMEADGLEEIERGYGADAGDYYTQGDSFSNTAVPNSKRYDGTPTGVTVDAISAYAEPMTFGLDCAACIVSCTATAPAAGTTGVAVAFQSTAAFSPAGCGTASFAWDFDGDGTTDSTLQNPSCTYATAGTFTWKLTVTGTNAAETCVKTGTIVISPPCILTCSATVPSMGTAGTPVQFRAAAVFSPTGCGTPTFRWDFDGDGTTDSMSQNSSHTYANAGTYTWKLTVTGTNGSGTCTKTGTITVIVPCTLSCTATVPATGSAGDPVSFQATATPSNCTGSPAFTWTFGDGGTSSQQNPAHTYPNAGTFTWSLTVTLDGALCTRTGTITVAPPCALACTATAPASGTPGIPVAFQATATPSNCTGNPAFTWTFGDGGNSAEQNPSHTYTSAGTFTWTLAVTVQGVSCTEAGTIAVVAPCTLDCAATVPASGISGQAVAFQSAATPSNCTGNPAFTWIFGDGGSSAEQNPSHTYASAGMFAWSVTATVQGVSCTETGTIAVVAPCILACTATAPASGIAGTPISFQAAASPAGCAGGPIFTWTFGDGATSTEQNPSHAYASAGSFTWTLTVSVDGQTCSQTGVVAVESRLPGDGDGDGSVSIGEVQQAITMFLNLAAPGNGVDCNGDGMVSIGEVQKVINAFLGLATSC